jgi:hypothetical protein
VTNVLYGVPDTDLATTLADVWRRQWVEKTRRLKDKTTKPEIYDKRNRIATQSVRKRRYDIALQLQPSLNDASSFVFFCPTELLCSG